MPTTSFTQLTVWQKAHEAALTVHRLTKTFPDFERVELGRQMRRAAMSIPSNIAEGFGRRRPRDKGYFYVVASGSLEEVRYGVIFARDLGYLESPADLMALLDEVGRMLGLSPARRTLKLALPAAIPGIMVGVRVAAGIAIVVTITTEIVANPRGLGHAMTMASQSLQADLAWATLLWVGIVGWCANAGMLALEQRWLRWYWAGRT